ncbi:hypothetical protein GGS26DRAFT_604472 [Hypomontagnella submonticulosa]|nr:hypothetical protein GGS26DRAFT_604472 [Hypomontagnella submonticulosa]
MADQVSKFRIEAKKMAAYRRARKEKHRLMRRWVYKQYTPSATADDKVDLGDSDSESESTPKETMDHAARSQSKIWDYPAYHNNAPLEPEGVTLDTMLQIAKNCYSLASIDFDKMSLFDHITHIQEAMHDPKSSDPVSDSIVSRAVVVMAQQQLGFAKKDFPACIARLASISLVPAALKPSIKTCQDCYSKFMPSVTTPCSCDTAKKTCFHGPCQYHPGNIRCWNDSVNEKFVHLEAGFLDNGKVRLKEFGIWIHQCYWDCCGGKLVEPGPEAGKRSQRKKDQPLLPWEVANDFDGSVGCRVRASHIAIQ